MKFQATLCRDGRLTVIEVPFNAKEVYRMPKGTILVCGTVNGVPYRGKLLSKGGDRQVLPVDKGLQKLLGYRGEDMVVVVTMDCENPAGATEGSQAPATVRSRDLDALSAIIGRRSIRKYEDRPVEREKLEAVLRAGLSAPSAKNKRPFHFVAVQDRQVLTQWGEQNSNAKLLRQAPLAIVVCGDSNAEGNRDFLNQDCAAAAQSMLIAICALGLGGVWYGVPRGRGWGKQIADTLNLPLKVEPIAVIAFGYSGEKREEAQGDDTTHLHFDSW